MIVKSEVAERTFWLDRIGSGAKKIEFGVELPTIPDFYITNFPPSTESPLADSRAYRLNDTTANPLPPSTTASQQQTWLPPPASARQSPPQPTFTDFDLFQPAATATPAPAQATPRRVHSLASTQLHSSNTAYLGALYAQGHLNSRQTINNSALRNTARPARPPVPLFHSNSTGNLDSTTTTNFPVTDFNIDTMGVKTEPNVAYHSTFGDLSSTGGGGMFGMDDNFDFGAFGADSTFDFTAVNGNGASGPTVSPKDIFNTDSVPPSTSFTNLTTPGSTYLDTPDDSFETSPMYESFDNSKTWSSLFPEEDISVNSFAPSMTRTTSTSSASATQIVVHPGGESLQRKRSSATNSPATFSPAIKHSSVAGVNARKRDKPLPPILVDENDPVALKRARNTAAARKSRAKKVLERDDLETQIANLKAEVEKYKNLARAHGAQVDDEE